jgi:Caspase domain/Domain of unknown function (DUF4440)
MAARFLTFAHLFIATLVVVAGIDSGSAAGRVALVIGNSAYQALPVLPNPANDATDVAAELGEMGYDVTVRTNATRAEMANVIARFAEKVRGAELALLFYAGHGVQLNGENYLLPVDATGETEAALTLSTIDLSSLQDAMADAGANVIILDACRNNPFADAIAAHRGIGVSRGLTPMDTRGRGSLIVFSTKPNSVAADGEGRNSPFTAALIRHMSARGLEIRQMISRVRKDVLAATGDQQVPWDNSSLVDDVYLVEGLPPPEPTPRPAPVVPLAPQTARRDPCATASVDDLAAPVRNLFTALSQLDLALYADQWAEDAIYRNSKTGEIRDRAQIIAAKQRAFPRWSRVGVEVRGPRLVSRNATDAVLEDEYTLRIVAGGQVEPPDTGRERYTVRCSADGRWAIIRNDDYLP